MLILREHPIKPAQHNAQQKEFDGCEHGRFGKKTLQSRQNGHNTEPKYGLVFLYGKGSVSLNPLKQKIIWTK